MTMDRDTIKRLATTQRAILSELSPSLAARGVLPKSSQLSQYRQLTGSLGWVDEAMQSAQHPAHKRLLRTLKEHGWGGLSDYLTAMKKLDKG